MLVPVPLHPRRRRERRLQPGGAPRGRAGGRARAPRVPRTPWCAARTRRPRRASPRRPGGATWRAPSRCAGRRAWPGRVVVLVDDVLTTGATTRACAEVLRARAPPRSASSPWPASHESKEVALDPQSSDSWPCSSVLRRWVRPVAPRRPGARWPTRRVTSEAIDTLPKGLQAVLQGPSAGDPEPLPRGHRCPRRAVERRFAADRLLPFPFSDLPGTEAALKARHAEEAGKVGRLPWLVQESYARLVEAFKARDKARILTESDMLAGLVADLHNPLALTDNADGQKTGQHGLWVRFSARFPEVAGGQRLKLDPEAARFLDKPKDYVFSMINGQLRLAGQPPLRGGARPARQGRLQRDLLRGPGGAGGDHPEATASARPPATWAATGTRRGRRPAARS